MNKNFKNGNLSFLNSKRRENQESKSQLLVNFLATKQNILYKKIEEEKSLDAGKTKGMGKKLKKESSANRVLRLRAISRFKISFSSTTVTFFF